MIRRRKRVCGYRPRAKRCIFSRSFCDLFRSWICSTRFVLKDMEYKMPSSELDSIRLCVGILKTSFNSSSTTTTTTCGEKTRKSVKWIVNSRRKDIISSHAESQTISLSPSQKSKEHFYAHDSILLVFFFVCCSCSTRHSKFFLIRLVGYIETSSWVQDYWSHKRRKLTSRANSSHHSIILDGSRWAN
jgi:hypothetical protein